MSSNQSRRMTKGLTDSHGRPINASQAVPVNPNPNVNFFEKEDHSPLTDFIPNGKLVALQPSVQRETKAGLIVTSQLYSPRGTVIAVGPEVTKFKVGQVVVCSMAHDVDPILDINGRNFVTIPEDNISGVMIPKEKSDAEVRGAGKAGGGEEA